MTTATNPASLIRDARRRHGLGQRELAHRAGTSQTQVSRIERGEVSPTVSTVARLLAAMGERLELRAHAEAAQGRHGYLPSHVAERRAEFRELTPAERVAAASSISWTATRIAAAAGSAR